MSDENKTTDAPTPERIRFEEYFVYEAVKINDPENPAECGIIFKQLGTDYVEMVFAASRKDATDESKEWWTNFCVYWARQLNMAFVRGLFYKDNKFVGHTDESYAILTKLFENWQNSGKPKGEENE